MKKATYKLKTIAFIGVTIALLTTACGDKPKENEVKSDIEMSAEQIDIEKNDTQEAKEENTKEISTESKSDSIDLKDLIDSQSKLTEYSYKMKSEFSEGRVYIKGSKYRIDMNVVEEDLNTQTSMIVDPEISKLYSIDNNAKTALVIEMDGNDMTGGMDIQDLMGNFEEISKSLGSNFKIEKSDYNGIPVKVIEFETDDVEVGSVKIKYYFGEKDNLLYYYEMETTGTEMKMTMEFSDYKIGNLEDSLFEIPEGYTIQDMSSLMEGMGDMMNEEK